MIGEQFPKEDSYTLVVKMLLQHNDFQSAMKYVKLASQFSYINPMEILVNAVVNYSHNAKASKQRTRIKAKISKSLVSIFGSYKVYLYIHIFISRLHTRFDFSLITCIEAVL